MNCIATHKFGIIEQFEENKFYCKYEPEKYNCISVDIHLMDDVIDNFLEEWGKIKTYLGSYSKTYYGLEENGITIIPPESLVTFRQIIINANTKVKSTELINLINKVNEAIRDNKYLIHFGV